MNEYTCKIIRVIDGDTVVADILLGFDIVLMNQKLRIVNVDTPEIHTRDKVEKHYGHLSKTFVENLLTSDSLQQIVCKDSNKGKFGRIICDFKIGNDMLSQLLIDSHMGVPYTGNNKDTIAKLHLENRLILESILSEKLLSEK